MKYNQINNNFHKPVLLNEAINNLEINPDGIYIDLTLGRLGHAKAILKKLSRQGIFIGFDQDHEAIDYAHKVLETDFPKHQIILVHSNFINLKTILNKHNIKEVDGILIDLGISSPQVDDSTRGFSYNKEALLDMRMNLNQQLNAKDVVNDYDFKKLSNILWDYGEIKFARKIAKIIIDNRPIKTTTNLCNVIKESLPAFVLRKKNPCKAIFQAIRIEVNDEINNLKTVLPIALEFLKPKKGRMVIISFHSLEDAIIKKYFYSLIRNDTGKLPIIFKPKWETKKFKPSSIEIDQNKRSRSAILRVMRSI